MRLKKETERKREGKKWQVATEVIEGLGLGRGAGVASQLTL